MRKIECCHRCLRVGRLFGPAATGRRGVFPRGAGAPAWARAAHYHGDTLLLSASPFPMSESAALIQKDVEAIGRLPAVPTLLRVLCDTTGMGFAAVARVTDSSWTACAVQDDIAFGLAPGGQLDLASTLCKEVREARERVRHRARQPGPGLLQPPHAEAIRDRGLHLGADHHAGRRVLRHALRHRSPAGVAAAAGGEHLSPVRRADRAAARQRAQP